MLNWVMGFLLGIFVIRRSPTLVMSHMVSNHSVTAKAVANGSSVAPPNQTSPVVVNVYPAPSVQASPTPTVPNNPQAQSAPPATPVAPLPTAQQPLPWPAIAAIALMAAIFVMFLVGYFTDPVHDIDDVMLMGGNEVEQGELVRYASVQNGVWIPKVSYIYEPSVHSLQDVPGAQFHILPGWEMQTTTVVAKTTFRSGERHRTVIATFSRTDGLILWLQRLFHR